jgi:predicted Zn-dependent protease
MWTILLAAQAVFEVTAAPPLTKEPDKEAILVTQLVKHIEERDGRLQDAAISNYMQDLAKKLAVATFASPLDVRITGGPDRYAILLPRRILYVSSGLMLRTGTEGELAAILAHEGAHSATIHLLHANPPASVVWGFGNCVLSSPMVPLGWASNLRQAEVQANAIAAQNLRSAHYDPASLFVVLSKLANEHASWEKALVSDDLEAARSIVESEPAPGEGYITDTSRFVVMHEELEQIAGKPSQSNVTLLRH